MDLRVSGAGQRHVVVAYALGSFGFSISAPCQSFSQAGREHGWASQEGAAMAWSLAWAGSVQAQVILVENVAKLRQKKHFWDGFLELVDWIGYRVLDDRTSSLSEVRPAIRNRLLCVLVPKSEKKLDIEIPSWPMLMKPSLIRANAWIQDIPEDIVKDWIVDIQALDLLEDPRLLPAGWMAQADNGADKVALGARLQKKNEQMSAGILMASYTSQHLIPLSHLLKKGLLTKVREQQGGYRYVTSHEQALALGVTQDVFLPAGMKPGQTFLGNCICPAHALQLLWVAARILGHMDRSFKDIFHRFESSLVDVKSVNLWIDKGWVKMSKIEHEVREDLVIETLVISPTLPWTAHPGLEIGQIQDALVSADPVIGIEVAKGQDLVLRRMFSGAEDVTEDALARTFAAALKLLPGLFGEETLRERLSFAVNLLAGEKQVTRSMNQMNTECKVLVHCHGVVCFELVIPSHTENGGLCEALRELSKDPTLAIIRPGSGTMRPDCTIVGNLAENAGILLLDMVATRIVEDTDLPFEASAQDHGRDAQDSCTVFFEKAGRTKAAVIPRIVSENEIYAVEREIFGFEEEGTVYFKGHMLERSCGKNWRVEQHDTFVVTRPIHGGMPKVVVTIRQGQDKRSGQWNLQAGHSFSVFAGGLLGKPAGGLRFEDAVTNKKWRNNVPTEAFRVLGNGQIFLEVRLVKPEPEGSEKMQVFVEEFGRTRVVRLPVNPTGKWICRTLGVDASQVVWLRSRRVHPTEEVLSVNKQDVFRVTRRLHGGTKGQPSAYKQGTLLKAKGRLSGLLIGKGAQQGAVSSFVESVISKAGEAHLVQLAGNKQEPVLWRQLQETVEKFGLDVEGLKPCTLKPAATAPRQGGEGGHSRASFSVDLRDFALEGLFKNGNDEAVAFHRTWSCLNRGVSVVEIHELETVMQRGKFLCVDECTVLTLTACFPPKV